MFSKNVRLILCFYALASIFAPSMAYSLDTVQEPGVCLQGSADNATSACSALFLAYPGQLFFPNTINYTIEADGKILESVLAFPDLTFF